MSQPEPRRHSLTTGVSQPFSEMWTDTEHHGPFKTKRTKQTAGEQLEEARITNPQTTPQSLLEKVLKSSGKQAKPGKKKGTGKEK